MNSNLEGIFKIIRQTYPGAKANVRRVEKQGSVGTNDLKPNRTGTAHFFVAVQVSDTTMYH
ncbi:MAG TPA: hypothetical protein VF610_10020 [Segetibacter sp.]